MYQYLGHIADLLLFWHVMKNNIMSQMHTSVCMYSVCVCVCAVGVCMCMCVVLVVQMGVYR